MTINKKVRGQTDQAGSWEGGHGANYIAFQYKSTLKGATSILKLSTCVEVAGFTNKKAVFGAVSPLIGGPIPIWDAGPFPASTADSW